MQIGKWAQWEPTWQEERVHSGNLGNLGMQKHDKHTDTSSLYIYIMIIIIIISTMMMVIWSHHHHLIYVDSTLYQDPCWPSRRGWGECDGDDGEDDDAGDAGDAGDDGDDGEDDDAGDGHQYAADDDHHLSWQWFVGCLCYNVRWLFTTTTC